MYWCEQLSHCPISHSDQRRPRACCTTGGELVACEFKELHRGMCSSAPRLADQRRLLRAAGSRVVEGVQ